MSKIWAKRFFVFGIYVVSEFRANPHKEFIKPITYFFRICNYVRLYNYLVQRFPLITRFTYNFWYVFPCSFYVFLIFFKYLIIVMYFSITDRAF